MESRASQTAWMIFMRWVVDIAYFILRWPSHTLSNVISLFRYSESNRRRPSPSLEAFRNPSDLLILENFCRKKRSKPRPLYRFRARRLAPVMSEVFFRSQIFPKHFDHLSPSATGRVVEERHTRYRGLDDTTLPSAGGKVLRLRRSYLPSR